MDIKSKKILWLLNAGHGIDTKGKRSPAKFGDVLYEFEFNRDIVRRIEKLAQRSKYIQTYNLVPEIHDVPLDERSARANRLNRDGWCIGIDIHANAGGGEGTEFYSSLGDTYSDIIAVKAVEIFKASRGHKERNFHMLRETTAPWILGETEFMDTAKGYSKLRSEEYRQWVADSYFELMKWVEADRAKYIKT